MVCGSSQQSALTKVRQSLERRKQGSCTPSSTPSLCWDLGSLCTWAPGDVGLQGISERWEREVGLRSEAQAFPGLSKEWTGQELGKGWGWQPTPLSLLPSGHR